MPTDYLDISVPIHPDMLVWSTHERVSLHTTESLHAGRPNRVTTLQLTTHTGTHLDAPYHFVADGPTVDRIPLDTLIGPCRVLDLQGIQAITPEKLSHFALRDVSRILLKTDNSRWVATGPMPDLPAHLTEDAAHHLAEKNVALLGFDGLSVDHPSAPVAHAVLLDAGVIILETIDLTDIAPGDYHLTCLPLRIAGADGAPARATLQPL